MKGKKLVYSMVFSAILITLPSFLWAEEIPRQQWIQRATCGELMNDFFVDSKGNSYAVSIKGNASLILPYEMVTCKYDSNGNLLWSAVPEVPAYHSMALTVDPSGNVYVATQMWDVAGFGGWLLVTIKYNANGQELWRMRSVEPDLFSPHSGRGPVKIALDSQRNIYVATTGTSVYAVIKHDNNGNQLWAKNYSPLSFPSPIALRAMSVDASGNVFMSGGNATAYITVKFDTNGNLLWENIETGRSGNLVMPTSMVVDLDGNVYVTGISIDLVQGDYLTVKYDANGNRLWTATYNKGSLFTGDFPKIKVDTDKNVYVTGGIFASIKYDANGNLLWAVGQTTSSDIFPWVGPSLVGWAYGLALDTAGNIYMTGQGLTLKRDTNGNVLWAVPAPSVMGFIEIDESGSVYIAGSVASFPATSIIVKYNQIPTIIPVQIDIKPGTSPNAIKLQDTGNIPVAIFSSQTFDARTIDVASLKLNGAGVRIVKGKGLQYSFDDVNGDGLIDLMVHFDRGALQLTAGDTTATVIGVTLDSKQIQGTDTVEIIE